MNDFKTRKQFSTVVIINATEWLYLWHSDILTTIFTAASFYTAEILLNESVNGQQLQRTYVRETHNNNGIPAQR
jgi:hypothetical protein